MKLFNAFILGFQNIKSHFLHTLLSILGVVIGVAALVGILSLIDSMESYVGKKISNTTSLERIAIFSLTSQKVGNTFVKKENYHYLDYQQFSLLKSSLSLPIRNHYLYCETLHKITVKETADSVETIIRGISSLEGNTNDTVIHGRLLTEKDQLPTQKVIVLNQVLAAQLCPNEAIDKLISKKIIYNQDELEIIGILKTTANFAYAYVPITLLPKQTFKTNAPQASIQATKIADVVPLKKEIEDWLRKNFKNATTDFQVSISEGRVAQAKEGFFLAKIIAGLIVGISVLVGGIGIMNVLLISVTERTIEIGIQKAVGAKKIDIVLQFLSESLCISFIGSGLGLVLGVLGTFAITPLITLFIPEITDFQAHFSWGTLITVGVIALIIGVTFGTYPAMKAANLDPVEAIRRE